MYDVYGGYGGMYPASMLVQTYPGGPLVAAVPVPMPVQWNGAAAAAAGSSGVNGGAEMGFYYALGYPAGTDMTAAAAPLGVETSNGGSTASRRNSVESYPVNSFCS